MAASVNFTYDNTSRREDLLDFIMQTTPTEHQLLTGLGVSKANDIIHQWQSDTLKAAALGGAVEGADPSYATRATPTRLTNYCQIIQVPFSVTDTERSVVHAGFSDRYTYEAQKAVTEWKNDAEYNLMRSSLVCGNNSTARQLKGIKFWLTVTSNYSGTTLTESILNDAMAVTWGLGVEVDAIYCGIVPKRRISAFTAGATKNVETTDKRLVNVVDVYESDAARLVKLFKHRYVTVTGDTYNDVVAIKEDLFKNAYLRKPTTRELAKTGDATNGQVIGEMTLECRNVAGGVFMEKTA